MPMKEDVCPCCGRKKAVYDVPPHPDDVRDGQIAKQRAAKVVGKFALRHHDELVDLLQTYADRDSHVKLDKLRAAFWGSEEWFS